LTSREVLSAARESRGNSAATFYQVLKRTRPDYIVLRSFEVDRNRAFHGGQLFQTREQRSYFDENYEELKRFSVPGFGGPLSFLTVFARRDAATSGSPRVHGTIDPEKRLLIGEGGPWRPCAS